MDTRRRATYVENKPDMAGQRGPLAACWRLIGRSWPKLGACSGAQRSHRSASWPKAEPARLRHGVPRWSWRAGVPPRPATCYGRLVNHSRRGRASWRATVSSRVEGALARMATTTATGDGRLSPFTARIYRQGEIYKTILVQFHNNFVTHCTQLYFTRRRLILLELTEERCPFTRAAPRPACPSQRTPPCTVGG